ncbi:MAG: hypothetical protein ABIE36_01145 [Candidatus Diapherotrites archaeon]
MKRGLIIFGLLFLFASTVFVSASGLSDFWNKITGRATQTCTDSDEGMNYFIHGTTTDLLGTVSDGCSILDGKTLTEYYCSDNSKTRVNYICPNGCQNGACVQVKKETTCTDSDGGYNIMVKGTLYALDANGVSDTCRLIYTNSGGSIQSDSVENCNGENCFVMELYCLSNNNLGYEEIKCEDGCIGGACIEEKDNIENNNFCTDSDGGMNYFIYGTTTDSLGAVSDGCSILNDNTLTEYYCSGNSKAHVNYLCPSGCQNGACIGKENNNDEENSLCTDSDEGMNYFIYGTTTDSLGAVSDGCSILNDNTLTEYYCSGNSKSRVNYICPNGCQNGACMREEENSGVTNPPSLLIFISPQYSNEDLIIEAVNKYQNSLKKEGFSSKVIKLTNSENTISQIRKIILTEVKKDNSVKAGLFIGEDLFSSVTNFGNVQSPQYNLFEILDEPINYITIPVDFSSGILPDSQTFQPSDDASIFDDIIARGDTILFVVDNSRLVFPNPDFFISSLMPPESYPIDQKINKIIFALNKFTKYHNNPVDYGNLIRYKVYNFSFENDPNTPLITLSSFNVLGNLQGEITGPGSDCLLDKSNTYKSVLVWGHGDPSCVYLPCTICSEEFSSLKTPFIIVSGCSTGGWYTNESFGGRKTHVYNAWMPPNFQYQEKKLISESIFDSNDLIALESGLMQPGEKQKDKDYIDRFVSSLKSGKTIAEAHLSGGGYAILWFYGDPFFHYPIPEEVDKSNVCVSGQCVSEGLMQKILNWFKNIFGGE